MAEIEGAGEMAHDPNRGKRLQYVWPWLGFAALIGLMWAVFAD